jgi:hypothetical protein
MVDGWPDENQFRDVVDDILERARGKGRKVRAFGEMVALMWARGEHAATVRMEYLWHELCAREMFCLFCAYPKIGFTEDPSQSMARVLAAHSKILSAEGRKLTPAEGAIAPPAVTRR